MDQHATARTVSIPALDGYALAADVWPAPDGAPSVIINGAMGVHRRFYRAFAAHLARHGLRVVTYDYRGIGGSAPRRLRGFAARARDWGQLDFPGVLRWAREQAPTTSIAVLGHSIGGQLVGLGADHQGIARMLLIGAQAGNWRHWSGLSRLGLAALWFAGVPALTALAGKLPMRWFRLGENVPPAVAREWAAWGRSPGYLFDPRHGLDLTGYGRLAIPVRVYSFADDRYAPGAAIEALLRQYPAARIERHHQDTAQLGARRVGHFGFFRSGVTPELWQEATEWLAGQHL